MCVVHSAQRPIPPQSRDHLDRMDIKSLEEGDEWMMNYEAIKHGQNLPQDRRSDRVQIHKDQPKEMDAQSYTEHAGFIFKEETTPGKVHIFTILYCIVFVWIAVLILVQFRRPVFIGMPVPPPRENLEYDTESFVSDDNDRMSPHTTPPPTKHLEYDTESFVSHDNDRMSPHTTPPPTENLEYDTESFVCDDNDRMSPHTTQIIIFESLDNNI